ncbi:hypothetical protein [Methylobacterium sp. XJLW]|nr:hypothetical protein [Methylobacterium sp. XJLW]
MFLTVQQIGALPTWMQASLFAAWVLFVVTSTLLLVRVVTGR